MLRLTGREQGAQQGAERAGQRPWVRVLGSVPAGPGKMGDWRSEQRENQGGIERDGAERHEQ